ncbi:MAG TPA: sulfurtransferase [Candidatus Nitrosotenuis sp.]|jgi:thiosulfate/3-mercaptopyruvate sulfurtransferase|nr:sulfurtransferase [Candidatus Nitrosotenuis sp.]
MTVAVQTQRNILVDTRWVADNLNRTGVKIIEVDVDTSAYDTGHIPGALAFNWQSQLNHPVRRDILDKEAFEALMSQSGIGPDDALIFYGDNNNWFAAFALWVCKIYGHEQVYLMDGGRKKWELEGRPLSTEKPPVTPTSYRAKDPDFSLRAYRDEILQRLSDSNLVLVDVRSPAEFTGEIMAPPGLPETAQRAGHIPGARNIPWAMAVREDGSFKSAEELREIYQSRGVTPDKDVIAYCRIGERSSHTWVVLRYLLDYPRVRNYDGSWTEWGSIINAPIEK